MQRQDYQTGAVQPRQRENLRREGRREGEDEVRRGGRGGWMYERGRARIEVRRRGGGIKKAEDEQEEEVEGRDGKGN